MHGEKAQSQAVGKNLKQERESPGAESLQQKASRRRKFSSAGRDNEKSIFAWERRKHTCMFVDINVKESCACGAEAEM